MTENPSRPAAVHPPRRPRGFVRTLFRAIGFCLLVFCAFVALFVLGPLIFIAIMAIAIVIDRLLRHRRELAFVAQSRARRAAELERAIEAGGPSDRAAHRRGKPDLAEVERSVVGPRHTGYVGGIWPRGRI